MLSGRQGICAKATLFFKQSIMRKYYSQRPEKTIKQLDADRLTWIKLIEISKKKCCYDFFVYAVDDNR